MEKTFFPLIDEIAEKLTEQCGCGAAPEDTYSACALKVRLEGFISSLRMAMFPRVFLNESVSCDEMHRTLRRRHLGQAALTLRELLSDVLPSLLREEADGMVAEYLEALPGIAEMLKTDVQAGYDGDPAAKTTEEIMFAYPSFEALTVFRLAHKLYEMGVPLLPRMMTEYAHERTGIDIHPGAQIGPYFFIDHGTGVVIWETTVIGHHVKLYQGVTLGARSFETDENGNPVKGIKRHPNIGNHVVIYAGATILGGDTYIGDRSVIGGNVWLTSSVGPDSILYYQSGLVTKKK